MRKLAFFFFSTICTFNMLVSNSNNITNVHAYTITDTTISEFDTDLNQITITDVEAYFNENILQLESQKSQSANYEKNIIEKQIKGFKSILLNMKNKHIDNKIFDQGKNLIRDKKKSYNSLSVINPGYEVVYSGLLAAIVVGNNRGYTLAARLLAISMSIEEGSTYDIWNTDQIINSTVKTNTFYKNKLSVLRNDYKNSGIPDGFTKSFKDLEFNPTDSVEETDMYYAIHGLNGGGSVTVNNGYGELILNDVYDFPGLDWPTDKGTALNDLGRLGLMYGICHIYNIKIHTVEPFYDYIPGSAENLIFDANFYADKYPDLKAAFGYDRTKLLQHWKISGLKEGRTSSYVFDPSYYLRNNPDVANCFGATNYQGAYQHFLINGFNEGRKSSPVYQGSYYQNYYSDLRTFSFYNLIQHFLVSGIHEGRRACSTFEARVYAQRYLDLRKAFGTSDYKSYFSHYLISGINEGRLGI